MSTIRSSEKSSHLRLLRNGAITVAVAAIVAVGFAKAQSSRGQAPQIKPGTNTSFGPLKQIDAGLLNVGYVEAGPADGPAVILLHGWPYDIYSYVDVTPLLASAGYRVIVPYLRGYGTTRFLSSETFRNGQQSAVALDIVNLMDALNIEKAVIAGFDWGARTADIMAALWPERCKGIVAVSGYLIGTPQSNKKPLPPKAELEWWYQFYFATERGRAGYEEYRHDFAKLIWQTASPKWNFDDATFNRSAASFDNPDHVAIVMHNYRWRIGLAEGESRYDDLEKRLAEGPVITVPAITLEGDANGAPHADAASYRKKFFGKYAYRLITGGVGHNLPQEAPPGLCPSRDRCQRFRALRRSIAQRIDILNPQGGRLWELQNAYSTRRRSYLSDLRTATLEPSDKPIPAPGDCTLPKLTGETAKAPSGEDAWSFRDADRVPFDDTLSTANRGAIVALAAWPLSWPRARRAFRRAWRLVRWKMVAIITFTLSSTLLVACLAVATLNVVLRRESTNVIEKQISTLVEASRSIAPAILDRAGTCVVQNVNSGDLKPLVQYAQGAFPQARISLAVDFRKGSPSLVPDEGLTNVGLPNWLPDTGFTGVVVDHGQLEIRNIAALEKGACRVAAIFRMPLGSELAKRLSLGGNSDVIAVSPRQFYVGGLSHKILGMIEANFLPGSPRPASVVLNVRNWETGAMEHWTAYEVRTSYGRTFRDLATIGSQLANWVWLLAAISFVALLIDASALWICVRLSRDIAMAIDDLSGAAQQIAGGNFAWRTPLRSNDQIGELTGSFNEMAASLEQFQKQEVTRLEFESDLRMAQRVQEYLFPRQAPVVSGATVAGRTLPARTVGGDLYDFFDLGQKQLGVLCADVSGKGVSAALMMANLQAVAHAHVGASPDGSAQPPALFVQRLNEAFVGRFGNNRYATLFWAEYDAQTRILKYVNAGHEPPILIRPTGEIERLETSGFPIGMFGRVGYASTELQVEAGSHIVIFTDGLADAQTPSGEEFGDERVIDCCRGLAGALSAEQLVERLMQAAASWSAGAEHFDDTTVVVVAVTP